MARPHPPVRRAAVGPIPGLSGDARYSPPMDSERSVVMKRLDRLGWGSGAPAAPLTPVCLRDLWRPAAVFVGSRVAVLLAVAASMAAVPGSAFGGLLLRWDGSWYMTIVQGGYSRQVPHGASNLGFFPLYPVVAWALARLPGLGSVDALVGVALVGGLVATVLVWVLTHDLAGAEAADRAAALFAFSPGAGVFSVAYSEGLFLAAAVGACLLLVRRSYLGAGVLCAAATATRPNGLSLVAVAAVSAGLAVWERREWRALIAPILAPLGVLAYFAYTWRHTGRFDAWYVAQHEGWNQSLDLTSAAGDVVHTVRTLVGDTPPDWNRVVPAVGLVLVAAGLVLLWRMAPPVELVVFTLAICASAATSSDVGLRPRFVLTAFPLAIALGLWARRPLPFALVLGLSAAAMAAVTVVTSTSLYLTP